MKNKKKIIFLLLFVFLLTGCTTILKDDDGKTIKNPETGQNLTKNILCQPTNEEVRKIYAEHGVEINSLPKCQNIKVFDNYEDIWANVFVKPLAWVIVKIGSFVKSYGFALIIVTLLLRLVMMPITRKSAIQSEQMAIAQPEIDKLEKKYKNKQSQEEMMQKSQELMAIYKKYKISPMSGCLFAVLQIPLFFAFYEAINRLPAIFEETFLGIFQLGTTPMKALASGQWYYLIFAALVIVVTYFSFNMTAKDTPQAKQMKMMTNVMVVVIAITSFSLPSGIALYWIFNSGFTVLQNVLVKRRKKNA